MKFKIEKIISFIWAGRERFMPDRSIVNVLKWHTKNPSFQMIIWIDQSTAPSNLISYYRERLAVISRRIFVHFHPEKFEFRDIEEEGVCTPFARYEINRLRPNFGASSDSLRIQILRKVGGAYFDSDVLPGKKSLENSSIFKIKYPRHCLYVDANSQNSRMIGNDAFISTKGNPVLDLIAKVIIENYCNPSVIYEIQDEYLNTTITSYCGMHNSILRQLYSYDRHRDGEYIERITPNKTGGGPVRAVISQEIIGKNPEKGDQFIDLSEYTSGAYNHRQWINQPLVASRDILKTVIESIRFEVEILKMLRLDDHIDNFASVTGKSLSDSANTIINMLEQTPINYSQLKGIQIIFNNPHTLRFYQKQGFPLYLSFWMPNPCIDSDHDIANFLEAMLTDLYEQTTADYTKKLNRQVTILHFLLEQYHFVIAQYLISFNEKKIMEFQNCLKIIASQVIALADKHPVIKELQNNIFVLQSMMNKKTTALVWQDSIVKWDDDPIECGSEMPEATTLSFRCHRLQDQDIEVLVLPALAKRTDMECLDLSCNNLSDASIEKLANIKVKRLLLWRNNICFTVWPLLQNEYLEFLDLRENPLATTSMAVIKENNRIQVSVSDVPSEFVQNRVPSSSVCRMM